MCEACSPPRIPHYEGRTLILERAKCSCVCPNTVFESKGPRCPRCSHLVKIELTDNWEDPELWINPRTRNTVKVDEITPPA